MLTCRLLQSYYTVAARLGDADAQQDLGFCLANGRGCKKDRKEAAKWYRAAVRFLLGHIRLWTQADESLNRLLKGLATLVWLGYTKKSFNSLHFRFITYLSSSYCSFLYVSCLDASKLVFAAMTSLDLHVTLVSLL